MLRLANFLERRMKVARLEDKPVPASAGEQTALQRPPRAPTRGDQWRDCLERLLEEDGYVIQASSEEMAQGASVRMWGTDQPFRVIEGADYADALRQLRVYQEVIGEEMEPPAPPSAQWHYYRYGPRP